MYFSRSKSEEDTQSVLSEIDGIRAVNASIEVSGALLCVTGENESYFAQFLEGPDDQVDNLYSKICKDNRHESIRLVYNTTSGNRFFENWSMGLISSETQFSPAQIQSLIAKIVRKSTNDIIEIMQEMYVHGA